MVDKHSPLQIWEFLKEVKDPEIPMVDIVGMGIVRDIVMEENIVKVNITTTYSGCPAMREIQNAIEEKLKEKGIESFTIKTILSPPWTTDWINEETKQKLIDSGISPPNKVIEGDALSFLHDSRSIVCPYCKSDETKKQSEFGSTLCKALYYCNGCSQPFEYFKCI